MAIARNISINNETYELEPHKGQRVYVGTCSTAAATNPKVCTVETFPVDGNGEPYVGTEIVVKFTATNSSTSTTPQLNVNGTGAIRIWYNNAVLASAKSAFAGYANRYLHYVYDGTYWVFMGHSVDNNSTYSNVALGQGYAVQNNSAASATITATLGSYALTANGIVSIKFLYDVPANATLNINSKGAKAIYNKDAAITSGVIKAGDTATFIYNTYYHLIAVDSWQDKQDTIDDLAAIRSGASLGATALQSYTETDPTVPAWAKASTKPSYTASEISGLATVATSGSYNDLADKPTAYVTLALTIDGNNIGTFSLIDGTALTNAEALALLRNTSIYVDIELYGSHVYSALQSRYSGDDQWSFQYIKFNSADRIDVEYVTINNTFLVTSTHHTIFNDENAAYFVPNTRKVNNKALSSDITLTASDVSAVPTTRTVNGKALSSDITLSASDVGALPSNTHIPADQVQSNWNETNTSSKAYIQNKPTIPAAQVNSDWEASSGVAQILNKPSFKTINGESIVGTGDIEAGSGDVATAFTITITSTTIEIQPMTGATMTMGNDISFQVA